MKNLKTYEEFLNEGSMSNSDIQNYGKTYMLD